MIDINILPFIKISDMSKLKAFTNDQFKIEMMALSFVG